MLWIGIGLIVASAVIQIARDFAFRLVDHNVLQDLINTWWYNSLDLALVISVPLGTMMVAAFFVARLLERGSVTSDEPAPRITAAWVFWTGVILTIFGLLVSVSLSTWLSDLNATGRTSLALDAANLVLTPLRTVIFPLGLALLPASVLMKKLEARSSAPAGTLQPTD